jgi:hypothetical protein
MSRQDSNDRETRVVRVDKKACDSLDLWAKANGMTIREVMDAIASDFLSAAPSIRSGALSRWLRDGRVATRRARARSGPQTLAAWQRMCDAEAAGRVLRQADADHPEADSIHPGTLEGD